ncbi:MAG: hypothetical protein ABR924_23520 [Terracidiphilus sp.]|jgi:hypothetical protein
MRIPYHPGRKTALMFLLGAMFCGLLVAFAVTSKVAAYYPHTDAARPIAANKIWQQQIEAVKDAPPVQAAPTFLLFVLVMVAAAEIARSHAWMLIAADSPSATRLCFRRAHATRPPPRN